MSYVLKPGFKLGTRSTRGHGDIYFITKSDFEGDTLVLDKRTALILDAIQNAQTAVLTNADTDSLERLVLEGVLSKTDGVVNADELSAESLQFWVQTTDRCNLACTYCYIPSLNSTQVRRPDLFSLFGQKLREVKGLKSVSIKLAGGEPLLSFRDWSTDVLDLKKMLYDSGIQLNVRVITNLTFLNKNIVEYIKYNKIGVSVSLDGLAENNDRNRIFSINGRGSFNIVKKNLEILRNHGIKPGVMITATSENSSGIAALIESLVQDDLVFRLSDAKGGHITPKEFETAFIQSKRFISDAVQKGYPVTQRIVVSDLRTLEPKATPCSMGTTGGAIYLDGSIYFCHTEFEKGAPLGNLDERDGLLHIIRRGYKKHLGLSADCRACEYRFICAGGCPLYRVNGKSPMCSAYKKIIPQIFDLYEEENARV